MLICVDMDGTLLDTVPANAASYRAALEELGCVVLPRKVLAWR